MPRATRSSGVALFPGIASPPKSPQPEPPLRKRPSVKTLLGSDYRDQVNDTPPYPPTLAGAAPVDYTAAAVKARLLYADCALRNRRRTPSPLHMHGLVGYRDACARLLTIRNGAVLDGANSEEMEGIACSWMTVIDQYEMALARKKPFMSFPDSDFDQELQEKNAPFPKG